MTSIQYNKKIKYVLIFIITVIILLGNNSYAIVPKTSEFFVNDSANLLSNETEEYIINMNKALESKTGAQIVVVTAKNLEGMSLEEYATKLFREYGIGDKEKNNGVLILCAYEERVLRVEVGYGFEGALPDGKTGRIQDEYIIPYLKENDFDTGIKNGFNAILQEVMTEYGITIDGVAEATAVETNDDSHILPELIMVAIFIMLIIFSGRHGIFFLGGFDGRGHYGGRRLFWKRFIWWWWIFWRRRLI